jgi:hypothetical protein
LTVTATRAVLVPPAPTAVSVYVVVCDGETDRVVVPVTVPIPLSMVTDVAPETFHDRTVDWPAVMEAGLALNDPIAGGPEGVGVGVLVPATVIVTCALALPPLLVAVKVYVVV